MCVIIFCSSACDGKVKDVQIADYSSEIYSNAEIEAAINVTIDYFKTEYSGCTLNEITYMGDDKLDDYQRFKQNEVDQIIVLASTFYVGAFGGDGSFNRNFTYSNWTWTLVRSDGVTWRLVSYGY